MNFHFSKIKAFRVFSRHRGNRRGAAAILILSMMFVFVVVAGVTIDYAYMQSVRSELRIATDAAAKAGAEVLSRTENSNQAIAAAIDFAASNKVAGQNLTITNNDVKLGRVTKNQAGEWQFQANVTPFNSVQVKPNVNTSLFFGKALGRDSVIPKHTAIAGYQEFDVCLCLDRSGSMLFDMTGTDFSYPTGNPRLSSFTAWGTTWRNHLSPPHPTNSRWAVLARAVNDFFNEIASSSPAPYTSLVTWGSDYTMPIAPSTQFTSSTLNVALPSVSNPGGQRTAITNSINALGVTPMMGGTNLSAGLDRARQHLVGNQARTLTGKVIILFTDGQWNEGRDPVLAAQDARDAGIVVHTVSMLTGFQPTLAQIAQTTGGRNFVTTNEAQLRAAFREIAEGLKVVLIE
jgi:Ca-activated chloride channel homolog